LAADFVGATPIDDKSPPHPIDDGSMGKDKVIPPLPIDGGKDRVIPAPPPPPCPQGVGKCGDGGKIDFCRTHPGVCRDGDGGHFRDHRDVRVIHKTVVVHDRDNNPQTILINSNLQTGSCFVSSQQVVDVPNLVTQLLNQCTSVTITP
jgi:hypothetical protein